MNMVLHNRLRRIEVNYRCVHEKVFAWEAIESLLPILQKTIRNATGPEKALVIELLVAHAERVESLTNISTTALELLLHEIIMLETQINDEGT